MAYVYSATTLSKSDLKVHISELPEMVTISYIVTFDHSDKVNKLSRQRIEPKSTLALRVAEEEPKRRGLYRSSKNLLVIPPLPHLPHPFLEGLKMPCLPTALQWFLSDKKQCYVPPSFIL